MTPMFHRSLRVTAVTALAALSLPLAAACDGPGGVTLGNDWSGSQVFVLAKVSGLTTVVGVDPQRGTAEPLAAVPTQADDDDVLSPQITRLADGQWVVTIPKKDRHPSVLYLVNTKEHGLDKLGSVQAGRVLVSAGQSVAGVSAADTSATGKATARMYDVSTWRVERTVDLPIDVTLTDGGPAGLCVGDVTRSGSLVTQLTSDGSTASAPQQIPGLQAQSMSCGASKPVLGGTATPQATDAGSPPALQLAHRGNLDVVTTSAGKIDQLSATSTTITAAVSLAKSVEVIQIARDTGKELRQVNVTAMNSAQGMRETPSGGLILTSGSTVATVDLGRRTSSVIKLPGEALGS